jgi:hypothetical protein
MLEVKPAVEMLDADNYGTWSIRMKAMLVSKGLGAAIEDAAVDAAVSEKALAQILLYVKDYHLMTLANCNTAKSAWELLKNTYEGRTNARKMLLRRELTMLKMQDGEPLTKYAARARDIQIKLMTAGEDVKDAEAALQFLAGLPAPYDMIRTVLTASDSELAIDTVLPKLVPVEQQTNQFRNPNENALAARHWNGNGKQQKDRDTRTCYACGENGHIARTCPNKRRGQRGGYCATIIL